MKTLELMTLAELLHAWADARNSVAMASFTDDPSLRARDERIGTEAMRLYSREIERRTRGAAA